MTRRAPDARPRTRDEMFGCDSDTECCLESGSCTPRDLLPSSVHSIRALRKDLGRCTTWNDAREVVTKNDRHLYATLIVSILLVVVMMLTR